VDRGGRTGNWQTFGPSGQARYADTAIQTSLMLRAAFNLALRQTEGLMASVLTLMNLTITAPDHTTVSRRAVALPVIQAASVPSGPSQVLIDSTGLQVYGQGSGWRRRTVRNRAGNGANCISRSMLTAD
jgi:hypothetical protein